MTPSVMISFANSLITGGSKVEASVKAFSNACHRTPTQLLGKSWYRQFLKGNADVLSTGKGFQKHSARMDWTMYQNIETMYNLVYEAMVQAGIAEHLPEDAHYYVNKENKVVQTEEEAAGLRCTMKLIRPDWLIFGDEVGTDTCQESDGHIGGQTYLQFAGQKISLTSSKASGRFTVIGLTAATGEPVMCVVVMASRELGIAEALGFDHMAETPYNKSLEENSGPGKVLPGLPTCYF